jgi:hypothetical protein
LKIGCRKRHLGLKEEEVIEDSTNLHNNFYCSLNIIRVIKIRGIRLAGNVARRGEKRNVWCLGGEGDLNKTTTWKT